MPTRGVCPQRTVGPLAGTYPTSQAASRPPSSSKMFLCTFASPSDPTSQLWLSPLPKRDEMIN